jgi:NADH-quinone oxidoreductase subunit E
MVSEKRVDEIIDRYEGEKGVLIQLLLDIQNEFNWVPKEAIARISTRLRIPISHIYRIVSFYKVLSLEPIGRHVIQVCLGTACHVRGGPRILDEVENILKIKACTTTEDLKFTIKRVNCIGCCALGPVMMVDEDYHGKLSPTDVKGILARYD